MLPYKKYLRHSVERLFHSNLAELMILSIVLAAYASQRPGFVINAYGAGDKPSPEDCPPAPPLSVPERSRVYVSQLRRRMVVAVGA